MSLIDLRALKKLFLGSNVSLLIISIFFKTAKDKNYFNLSEYIVCQLKNLDINKIEVINKNTYNIKNNFFSARRSKDRDEDDYGRNISIIMIN